MAAIIQSIRKMKTILIAAYALLNLVSTSLTIDFLTTSSENGVLTATSGHLVWQGVLLLAVIVVDGTTAIYLAVWWRLRLKHHRAS